MRPLYLTRRWAELILRNILQYALIPDFDHVGTQLDRCNFAKTVAENKSSLNSLERPQRSDPLSGKCSSTQVHSWNGCYAWLSLWTGWSPSLFARFGSHEHFPHEVVSTPFVRLPESFDFSFFFAITSDVAFEVLKYPIWMYLRKNNTGSIWKGRG